VTQGHVEEAIMIELVCRPFVLFSQTLPKSNNHWLDGNFGPVKKEVHQEDIPVRFAVLSDCIQRRSTQEPSGGVRKVAKRHRRHLHEEWSQSSVSTSRVRTLLSFFKQLLSNST